MRAALVAPLAALHLLMNVDLGAYTALNPTSIAQARSISSIR
jgi:hypothetical protein